MPATQQLKVRRGDVVVLVGTMKGAFLFRSGPDRARFEMGGPWFPGHSVYSMAYDGRADRGRIWAAASSMHWGALLNHSDDFGATWTKPEVPTVRFPEGTKALQNIWQIAPGRAAKWRLASNHLVNHHAQTEDICARIDRQSARLLG